MSALVTWDSDLNGISVLLCGCAGREGWGWRGVEGWGWRGVGGWDAGENAADLRGRARSGLLFIDEAVTGDTETVLFSSCEPDKPTHSLVQMGVFNVPT